LFLKNGNLEKKSFTTEKTKVGTDTLRGKIL
jgi:hypothetical protein